MNSSTHIERIEVKPFLKWAGGKRWLISKYQHFFPEKFNTYYEPFLGGGAIFFHIQPSAAILSDINSELIDTYSALKDDWHRVYGHLVAHHRNHSVDYYYQMREQKTRNDYTKAARLIYLNRTCWNGLYRVNANGYFNVPIGTKSKVISEEDDYENISNILQKTELCDSDFEELIDQADDGDFLFVDPPYTVKHNFNGFVKYNENLFAWDDQIRLRDALVRASIRGAKFLMTNACHSSVKILYRDYFDMFSVHRPSVISGNNSGRGSYEELLIYHGLEG